MENPPSNSAKTADPAVPPEPPAQTTQTLFTPSTSGNNNNDEVKPNGETDADGKPLSKNQQKKRRRWEKSQAVKKRRKDQARELKNIRAKKEGRDLDAERKLQLQNEADGKGWKKREEKWKEIMERADVANSFRVCFDCSFEDHMTWKETNSLSLQLRYVYSVNRRSTHPNHVDVCGIKKGGLTRGHMEKVEGFPDRWVGRAFQCYEGNLEEVYGHGGCGGDSEGDANNGEKCDEKVQDGKESSVKESEDSANNVSSSDPNGATKNDSEEQTHPKLPPNHQFVYLTGDSPNTLTTLDNNTTYIIGGIVDRNRLKQAAIQRAESINAQNENNPSFNIKTARLPLDEHLDFKGSTRILTCNHVFEILQKYRENGYKDWRGSIKGVLPDRKEVGEKKDGNKEGDVDGEEKGNDTVDVGENEDAADELKFIE